MDAYILIWATVTRYIFLLLLINSLGMKHIYGESEIKQPINMIQLMKSLTSTVAFVYTSN